jgi:hypothetical protein
MRLSREMKFHADSVAASVSGSQSLVTALHGLELANAGYTIVLKCDDLLKQKKVSNNIYQNQKAVMKELASEFKLSMENDIPVVSENVASENNSSRINFKDQWASHPAIEERVEHLNNLSIDAEVLKAPAWVIFDGQDELQSRLTQKMYELAIKEKDVVTIGSSEFDEKLNADLKKSSLPDEYNGFYDNRQLALINRKRLKPGRKNDLTLTGFLPATMRPHQKN